MKISRTSQALSEVDTGISIAEAAKKYGITRQSIYRLKAYRGTMRQCQTCGTYVSPERIGHAEQQQLDGSISAQS